MANFSNLEAAIVKQAQATICLTYPEKKSFLDKLISEITTIAQGSPVYKGRVKKIDRIDGLRDLPLTPYPCSTT